MPASSASLAHLSGAVAPAWTDYELLVAPYVPDVHDVLTGRKTRCKVHFQGMTILFRHGCLMARIAWQDQLIPLPPFAFDENGRPVIRLTVERTPAWLEDLGRLPRELRLFFLSLLKAVFDDQPLTLQRPDGRPAAAPAGIQSMLADAGWILQ